MEGGLQNMWASTSDEKVNLINFILRQWIGLEKKYMTHGRENGIILIIRYTFKRHQWNPISNQQPI